MRSTQSNCSGFMSTGTQASNRFAIALCRSQVLLPKTNRNSRYRQMQIAPWPQLRISCGSKQKPPLTLLAFGTKYDNVEFRGEGGYKPHILRSFSEKHQRCLPSRSNPRANSPPFFSGSNLSVAHKAAAAAPGRSTPGLSRPSAAPRS